MCSCGKDGLLIFSMKTTWIFLILAYETYAVGELAKCERVAVVAAWRDHQTVADTNLKTLVGTWISEGCETRPGPEYVLRSYSFNSEGMYFLVQHHYWDDSCSSPKLTVVSHGRITLRNSMVQPEASTGNARPINITVIPQDGRAADELNKMVSRNCPGRYWKSWKRNEQHVVFDSRHDRRGTFNLWSQSYQPITNHHPLDKPSGSQIAGDISCLGPLKWAFNELKLLKIQFRPIYESRKHQQRQAEMELFLGDIHTNAKRREFYAPTSFQRPLLRQTKGENFTTEKYEFIVRNSNSLPTSLMSNFKTPPHLIEKPHLPPYVWGQWVSTRCEIRPQDVYLLRQFTFYEDDFRWIGEHRFFADPFCAFPKFIITASGHFTIVGASDKMKGVSNINFELERASMVAHDQRTINEMRLPGFCGVGEWHVNVPKELAATNGCMYLGIVIPSIRYDIIKVEMDYKGSWLLFLGQADTNNFPITESERPTAFELPLMKCGQRVSFTDNFQERLERSFFFGSGTVPSISKIVINLILFLLYLIR